MCYIYNGQSERQTTKRRTSCPFSFAKVNKVNEASAFDQITGRESGAFVLPKTGSEDDDLKLPYINKKERGKAK